MASILNNEKYSLYFQKVRLMYKRPEIRASLEIILSVFTVTLLVFVAIRPTLINITQLQKKIEDQELVSKKADTKIGQLLSAQNQLNTFRNRLRLFDEAVPDSFTYTDGAKRLEYLAKKNNLSIDSISFPGFTLNSGGKLQVDWISKIPVPNENNILSEQVAFSVSGKPADVLVFIKEIENMDRLVYLESISLSVQIGIAKTEDILKATGKMTFYFYSKNK